MTRDPLIQVKSEEEVRNAVKKELDEQLQDDLEEEMEEARGQQSRKLQTSSQRKKLEKPVANHQRWLDQSSM